jgi:NAD-dependent SIR2 family protein deacetylase
MDPVRHITCTQCHWSLWTEDWHKNFDEDARCPRCGGPAVVGARPDDEFPAKRVKRRFRRATEPAVAVADTRPNRYDAR